MNSEWPVLQLKELLAVKPRNGLYKSSEFQGKGHRWVKMKDVYGHDFIRNQRMELISVLENEVEKFGCQNGDLLFGRTSLTLEGIGDCALVCDVDDQPIFESNLFRIRLLESKANPRFYFYYFKSAAGKESIQSIAKQTAATSITASDLTNLYVPYPPPEIQRVVARFFEHIDDRVTLLRETNATLEAIAQALFKSWFVDFDPVRAKMADRAPEGMDEATAALFPDALEETELGLAPKGWRVMPFLEACDLQGGAQPPASTFVDTPRDGYVRLLQIRDFSTDAHKTYIPDTTKLKKATEDDVLLGRYGSASGDKAKDSLGRVCRGLSGSYNVALMKLVPIYVGREFALQLVNDPRFYNYLQGVSSKAVQSGFSKSELGQYKVVVPPQELCDVFEDIGLALWERLKHGVARQRELAELRDALLPRLISGQLRLPEMMEAKVA